MLKVSATEIVEKLYKEAKLMNFATPIAGAATGAIWLGGSANQKAVDKAKMANPAGITDDDRVKIRKETAGGIAKGIAGGAAAGGVMRLGKVLATKKASESIDEIYKEAAMNVPTEEEKLKANNQATDSDNLKDIECEVCEYKGQPDSYGYCPECGTLGGVKPTAPSVPGPDEYDDEKSSNIYEESQEAFH